MTVHRAVDISRLAVRTPGTHQRRRIVRHATGAADSAVLEDESVGDSLGRAGCAIDTSGRVRNTHLPDVGQVEVGSAAAINEVDASPHFAKRAIDKRAVPDGKGILPPIDVTPVEFHALAVHINGMVLISGILSGCFLDGHVFKRDVGSVNGHRRLIRCRARQNDAGLAGSDNSHVIFRARDRERSRVSAVGDADSIAWIGCVDGGLQRILRRHTECGGNGRKRDGQYECNDCRFH